MGYDSHQFRDLIERTISSVDDDLVSAQAITLLLGTAAQESQFGTYLKQMSGPALGAFQMEPATFEWLKAKYEDRYPFLKGRLATEMEWDLRLAIIMARLRYRAVVLPIPEGLIDIAAYWKRHYNTPFGKGNPQQFLDNYHKYVG